MAAKRVSARVGLIWLAGLLAAAFSGMAAFGMVAGARAPLAALGTVPESGRVYAEAADFALKQVIRENGGALPDTIPAISVAWARQAFVLEPLAVQAPRIIAFAREAQGDVAAARRIMRALPSLSKREAAANVWLSQDYARLGQDARAFEYFDVTLRVSEGSAPLLIPPLVTALERPELRAPLARLLRAEPVWQQDFWLEAMRRPELALPAARLRMELGKQEGNALAVDRGLLNNLVQEEQFADALEYYRFLSGKRFSQDLAFPFDRAPLFPPLDWDLLTAGDFSAAIDASAGTMLISAGPATARAAARRLVPVDPGTYRAFIDFASSQPEDVSLGLTLRCSEQRAEPVRSGRFVPAGREGQLLQLGGGCRYYMLEIDYRNDAPIDSAEIAIDSIALRKER